MFDIVNKLSHTIYSRKNSSTVIKCIPIKMYYAFLLYLLYFCIIRCSAHITSEYFDSLTNLPDNVITAEFSIIQQKIFTPTCANSDCQSGTNPKQQLDLTNNRAFANLINVRSTQNSDLFRILPANSSQRYLIKKLSGDNTTIIHPSGMLTSAIIDSMALRITNGAPDN